MTLGAVSKARLATCHPDLVRLVTSVVDGVSAGDLETAGVTDVTVLCGRRGRDEQEAAFASGASKLHYPHSRHNTEPLSMAVDVAPYPVNWKNTAAFQVLRGYVLATAARLGIRIRTIPWDLPHYELPK